MENDMFNGKTHENSIWVAIVNSYVELPEGLFMYNPAAPPAKCKPVPSGLCFLVYTLQTYKQHITTIINPAVMVEIKNDLASKKQVYMITHDLKSIFAGGPAQKHIYIYICYTGWLYVIIYVSPIFWPTSACLRVAGLRRTSRRVVAQDMQATAEELENAREELASDLVICYWHPRL